MHQKIESRRVFLTKATIVAALGASTAKLFGEQTLSDITGDGIVNVNDLLEVVGNWGECP